MNNLNDASQLNKDMQQNGGTELNISSIINTLWLRKSVLISVTFFVSLLVVLYVYQLVPRYTATTQLLIGINSAKVVDIQEVLSGSGNKESAVTGEMEVIKSRELAHKIIKLLHLNTYEEFNPALKKSNEINHVQNTILLPSYSCLFRIAG